MMGNVLINAKCCNFCILFVLQSGLASPKTSTGQQVDVLDQPVIKELHSPIKGEFPKSIILTFTPLVPNKALKREIVQKACCCSCLNGSQH